MIVTIPQILVTLVLLSFLWLILDWIFGLLLDRGEAARLAKSSRECHVCGKRYPESRHVQLSECPACSAQNIKGGHRKLG